MASADPVLVTISNKPRAVLQTMETLTTQHTNQVAQSKRRRWLPMLFFLAGFPFLCMDFVMDYGACFFSLVTLGLWGAAVLTFISWRRGRVGQSFHPHFQTAFQVIRTIRDDLKPGQNLLGQLDLTGAEQKSKLLREGKSQSGAPMKFYRDPWLTLKAKLYDGNQLRLAAIERVKARQGFFKRGRSGKTKWRAGQSAGGQEITVKLAVNPQAYEIMHHVQLNTQIGQYFVNGFTANDGIIELSAASVAKAIQPEDILGVLKFVYDQLERKGKS